ncbi:hypothetical protein MalM25_22330 [Planctomycetes bacterium MalM25]|nr:hypothetical protein MalM25_22330 [Planctomycetes bacterium MalM25]
MTALGTLKTIELRNTWPREASDFTPWLSETENLGLLAETLGMELELIGREAAVGPYRADLVCTDVLSESQVLIENQLEKTDHSHLGQLLTYAAGLDSVSIIWIASKFSDEHRAALDWLNDVTDEAICFFGLEIELWQIDESSPAPKFNIVSKPNDWTKKRAQSRRQTETTDIYLSFWSEFRKHLLAEQSTFKVSPARAKHHLRVSIGKAGCAIAAVASQQSGYVRVELYLDGDQAKERYANLEENKDDLETAFGAALDWQPLPKKTASRIATSSHQCDITDRSKWQGLFEWLTERVTRFDKTFRGHVSNFES